jgi:hypothetical protein
VWMGGSKTLAVTTLVGVAHIVCGVAVLAQPLALDVTPLSTLEHLVTHAWEAGVLLVGVGVLAILARGMELKTCVFMLLPQQVLLLFQLWSISEVLITGTYPDGYAPVGGAWFTLADQSWTWLLTIAHTAYLAGLIYRGVRGGAAGN